MLVHAPYVNYRSHSAVASSKHKGLLPFSAHFEMLLQFPKLYNVFLLYREENKFLITFLKLTYIYNSVRKRCASRAAMHPCPAAVTAWRYTLSWTSPAAKIPGMLVLVEFGRHLIYPCSSSSSFS